MRVRALAFTLALMLGVWLAAIPWAFAAEPSCPPEYRAVAGVTSDWYSSRSAALAAWQTACVAVLNGGGSCGGAAGSGYAFTAGSCTVASGGEGGTCTVSRSNPFFPEEGSTPVTLTAVFESQIPEDCENECASKAGQKKGLWYSPGESASSEIQTSDGCRALKKTSSCYAASDGLPAICVATYEYDGSAADSGDETEADTGKPGDCASGPSGPMCVEPDRGSQKDCISLGGDTVCFETPPAPPEGCAALPSGGAVCFDDADPLPDNGTPGTPAPPNAVVSAGGNTYNWYTKSTLASSSTTIVTSGTPNASSGSSIGEKEGLDDLEEPELGSVPSFGYSAQKFYNDVAGSPLVSSFSSATAGIPAGTCPDWSTTIDAGFTSFAVDFTSICDMWDAVSGVLSAVMLIGWAWLAARILFSA